MKPSDPRQLAFTVLSQVEEGGFADLSLDAALARCPGMDPRDRGLATELVYGVLRQRGRLDFALARFCSKQLSKVESRVLNLLRLGAYQVLMLDRVPAPAAVHETVELARRLGLERATGFINGILRALIRGEGQIPWPDPAADPLGHLQHGLSLPAWLARDWLRRYGAQEAAALAEAMAGQPPFCLRVNTLKGSRDQYLEMLRAAGHQAEPTVYAPEGVRLTARAAAPLPGDAAGWYQVQDEASMLIAHLLGARPGERILDACSAPGGKTTHIAALAENRAGVVALDLHPQRVRLVEEGARRLGCRGIETRAWDLTRPPAFLEPGSFDRVLVDAPCSGLGVLRRNPEIRWRRGAGDIKRMAALQGSILDNVAALVRPGGVLVYSLCTLTEAESEETLARFLARQPRFAREDLRPLTPPGWAELFDDQGALRSFPHRHGGMDAFYAVRLRRQQGD
ncbi:ribosomal RNA small subunit methyltransferase B [Desulfuromonas versatilis]|uniref:16S rRNA (cytosine(967)-C(5))-methyltransferase n=1 Tax=Desulfuromonas versatilis TaxID=2802975 RepID=A0ABN6DT74_9BACT|nr:16S rRNA (cytosine(967)-C(5))-methyltransferase RsmB [Desulfuromonas versatilis]BCR03358.1 ribosomal RNA small subunit methyltransferase B [Desulfuromonas versatilis]